MNRRAASIAINLATIVLHCTSACHGCVEVLFHGGFEAMDQNVTPSGLLLTLVSGGYCEMLDIRLTQDCFLVEIQWFPTSFSNHLFSRSLR